VQIASLIGAQVIASAKSEEFAYLESGQRKFNSEHPEAAQQSDPHRRPAPRHERAA
jgi:hypothetical protein